jgi:hypothetical protein
LFGVLIFLFVPNLRSKDAALYARFEQAPIGLRRAGGFAPILLAGANIQETLMNTLVVAARWPARAARQPIGTPLA